VDPHTTLEAAWRALDLIVSIAGGRIVSPICKVGGDKPWKREIVVTPAFIRERLGFVIPEVDMKASLEALELHIIREGELPEGGASWTVSIPSWRDDIDRPIDLVEEVLRLFGTDRIPPAVVHAPGLVSDDDPIVRFSRDATSYLVGHDFHECVSYTLRSEKEVASWVAPAAAAELKLANPFVEEQSHLRPSLVPCLLESLKLNQSRNVDVSRLFETGRIFVQHDGQNLECVAVAFIIAEDAGRNWKQRESGDFYAAKHHVEALGALAAADVDRQLHGNTHGPMLGWQVHHSASSGEIARGWIAQFGLLDLALVKAAGVEGNVYAGQLAILPEKLAIASARRRFVPFSLFPAALRDLAVVAGEKVPSDEVRKALGKIARAAVGSSFVLENVSIFDVYQGKGLPEGKKSMAFSFVFRASDRTLTDDEVNGVFQKIQDEFLKTGDYQIRK
jgi:phenylalanyl-tRNA synthetase beta chain